MSKTKPSMPVRKPWIRPVVEKIAAGQAEVGTFASGDGAFTTS